MSVTQVPIRPVAKATRTRALFGFLLVIVAGVLLAWFGAGQLRGETTASGLSFRTIQKGEGPTIKQQDAVLIDYVGSLPDGQVFQSTEGRPVPMTPLGVLPGFAEALQKMQKGGVYKIRIPAKNAYGDTPPPGSPIPANSDLLFQIRVHEIAAGAGPMLMQQQMMQQQMGGAGGPPSGQ